jgi:trehalose 6-phosphate phosphatase
VTNVLSPGCAAELARVLAGRVLLAFDFDGTLAPIAVDREAARMRRRTHRLLEQVCALYPCAVVSGRRREDVLARLEGLPMRYVVGNHGLDPGGGHGALAARFDALRAEIGGALGAIEGVDLEDKVFSLAVHYRRASDRRAARRHIEHVLAPFSAACRILAGKLVYDVVARSGPHKGDAVLMLCERERAESVVYLGDDVTDEDVFELEADRLFTIRVGHSRRSRARYFIHGQRDVDLLLAAFIRARAMPLDDKVVVAR